MKFTKSELHNLVRLADSANIRNLISKAEPLSEYFLKNKPKEKIKESSEEKKANDLLNLAESINKELQKPDGKNDSDYESIHFGKIYVQMGRIVYALELLGIYNNQRFTRLAGELNQSVLNYGRESKSSFEEKTSGKNTEIIASSRTAQVGNSSKYWTLITITHPRFGEFSVTVDLPAIKFDGYPYKIPVSKQANNKERQNYVKAHKEDIFKAIAQPGRIIKASDS